MGERARGDPVHAGASPSRAHAVLAESLPHGREEDILQVTAMDRELRPLIAREASQGLAMDELTEAIEEDRFARLDGHAGERLAQPEREELARRMGKEVDAQAHGRNSGAGLEYRHGCRRHAAQAPA
jgi:hypothetical protein